MSLHNFSVTSTVIFHQSRLSWNDILKLILAWASHDVTREWFTKIDSQNWPMYFPIKSCKIRMKLRNRRKHSLPQVHQGGQKHANSICTLQSYHSFLRISCQKKNVEQVVLQCTCSLGPPAAGWRWWFQVQKVQDRQCEPRTSWAVRWQQESQVCAISHLGHRSDTSKSTTQKMVLPNGFTKILEATCSHTSFGDLKNSLINSTHLEPWKKIEIKWLLFRSPFHFQQTNGTKRHGNMPNMPHSLFTVPFKAVVPFLGSPTDSEDTRPTQLKPGLRNAFSGVLVHTFYTVSAVSHYWSIFNGRCHHDIYLMYI